MIRSDGVVRQTQQDVGLDDRAVDQAVVVRATVPLCFDTAAVESDVAEHAFSLPQRQRLLGLVVVRDAEQSRTQRKLAPVEHPRLHDGVVKDQAGSSIRIWQLSQQARVVRFRTCPAHRKAYGQRIIPQGWRVGDKHGSVAIQQAAGHQQRVQSLAAGRRPGHSPHRPRQQRLQNPHQGFGVV